MCVEWHDFNKFCYDVYEGSKEGLHLDREDNNKGYFKENCRWVTPKTNHRNKRNCTYYETHLGKLCQSELIEKMNFTRRQFQRAVEKYGIDNILEMFKKNKLPKKRETPNLYDIIGVKFGKLTPVKLDENKSTGARYFCNCDCGKKTRVSRFKLVHQLAKHCRSCSKKGNKNNRYSTTVCAL